MRLRRLRRMENLRRIFSETKFDISSLVMPYILVEGKNEKRPISSMPGIFKFSIDNLLKEIEEIEKLNIPSVILFQATENKDEIGSYGYNPDGIIQKAIKSIKQRFPEIVVITDVCLCSYTNYGHCGILKKGLIDEEATLDVLGKIANSHAERGVDIVGLSSMIDGQVKVIREMLDENGFKDIAIMSYSVKFASNFYLPFREAIDIPKFCDKRTYQLNYHNPSEALREIEADINEGVDIVMVKPTLSYLDIIRKAKDNFNIPLAAYNVSGEYSMIKAYCKDLQDKEIEKRLVLEILTGIKRAGADLIITYFAKEVANWIK